VGVADDLDGGTPDVDATAAVGVTLPVQRSGAPEDAAALADGVPSEGGSPVTVTRPQRPELARADLRQLTAGLPIPPAANALAAMWTGAVPRCGMLLGLITGRQLTFTSSAARRLMADDLERSTSWSRLDGGLGVDGALVVDDASTVALADLLLGGPGESEERRPTRLEVTLVRRHLQAALQPMLTALRPFGLTAMALEDPGQATLPVTLGGGELLAVRISVSLNDRELGTLTIALPARPLLGPTALQGHTPLSSVLGDVAVEVSVRFPSAALTAAEVRHLAPGDVLRLDMPSPLVVGVAAADPKTGAGPDRRLVLTGALGRRGRNKAVEIHAMLEEQ
jgi:hypothetical protein